MVSKKAKHQKYISLQNATKFCKYSQEYLSLRARQGKLKAEKIGRNWMTTKKWLKEYIKHIRIHENNGQKELGSLFDIAKPILKASALTLLVISISTGVVFGYPFFQKSVIEPTDTFILVFKINFL